MPPSRITGICMARSSVIFLGVFHQEYDAVNKRMLYKTVAGVGLEVRYLNGSLLQTINTGGITFTDIEYDQNTNRLFGINPLNSPAFSGKFIRWMVRAVTCLNQSVSSLENRVLVVNYSVQTMEIRNGVFEQNGNMSNEFGWVDGC